MNSVDQYSEMAWSREDLMWLFQPRGSGAEIIFALLNSSEFQRRTDHNMRDGSRLRTRIGQMNSVDQYTGPVTFARPLLLPSPKFEPSPRRFYTTT